MFEFNASIKGRELPRDTFLRRIAIEMPSRKNAVQFINAWNALP